VGRKLATTETISHIYTSDLTRAAETAELIRCELPCDVEVTVDTRLRERGFGCLEGLPVSELVAAAGRAQVRVGEYTPRGGETLEAVDHRLAAFLAELFRTISEMELTEPLPLLPGSLLSAALPLPLWHVLLVSHGGTIHSLCERLREAHGCQLLPRNAPTPNTALSSFLITLRGNCSHHAHTLTAHNTHHLSHSSH
jgi:broad specificity phosphatase PhoE